MERRHHSQSHSQRQQRRNHLSSSSNQSRSNNRFSFPKSSSSSSSCSANDVRDRRRETQEEKQEKAIVGTCPFMCPEEERLQRQHLRDLAVFERLHGDPRKSSPALAVKKFCRTMSAKEVQASDVRPLPVLEETLNYLLSLLDSTEHPFEVIHDFVFDRTRSVRQDLSMQNIVNDKAINMFERITEDCCKVLQMLDKQNVVFLLDPADGQIELQHIYHALQVKFHVISHHKLRSSCGSSSISPLYYLNLEQLTKALTSLYNLYEANRSSKPIHENEAEFRSFYVLLHLDSYSQPMAESLSLWFCHMPSPIIKSKEMWFARQALRYFRMGNYRHFLLTTAAEASCLQYCIIEPYIDEVRSLALCCINNSCYKLHPYPLGHLSKVLMMEESDVELFCNAYGLQTCVDEVGNKLLPTKQTTFCRPKGGIQNYSFLGFKQLGRQIEL